MRGDKRKMKGYKGVILKNGILRSKYNDIFEVGVPREKHDVDDGGVAFTEAGYSFCGSIEDVIYHEKYISTSKGRQYREVRLFEIDTMEGQICGNSYHHKASIIKLVREVTQKEILEYLTNNAVAKKDVIDEVRSDVFETYSTEVILPYRLINKEEEIEDLYVRACARLGQVGLCNQSSIGKLHQRDCEGCIGISWTLDLLTYEKDYLYLLARKQLIEGADLSSINEYNKLISMNCGKEYESLQRYALHIKNASG